MVETPRFCHQEPPVLPCMQSLQSSPIHTPRPLSSSSLQEPKPMTTSPSLSVPKLPCHATNPLLSHLTSSASCIFCEGITLPFQCMHHPPLLAPTIMQPLLCCPILTGNGHWQGGSRSIAAVNLSIQWLQHILFVFSFCVHFQSAACHPGNATSVPRKTICTGAPCVVVWQCCCCKLQKCCL